MLYEILLTLNKIIKKFFIWIKSIHEQFKVEKKNSTIFRQLVFLNYIIILYIILDFIFDISYYIFTVQTVHCSKNFLNYYTINNHNVYYYGNVSFLQAYNLVNTFNLNFNILKTCNIHFYNVIDGVYKNQVLDYKNPLRHPQLQILNYTDFYPNLSINFSSTKNNFNIDLFTLKKNSFNGKGENQFLIKNFYIYDSNFLTPKKSNFNSFLFNIENQKTILDFFKEIDDKYKINR